MNRVFLHVGAPKTGTTFLQATIAANRELLGTHGLTYPDMREGSHFEAAIDLLDHPWGGLLPGARGQWNVLTDAARSAPRTSLISHEILAAATPEQVKRAMDSLRGAEVHLIYSARDLARQVPAEWQETVKHRRILAFGRYLKNLREADRVDSEQWFWRVQNLPDVLRRWGTHLPPERIHLVTVPPAGSPKGLLLERFAEVLGFDPKLPLKNSKRANSSMGIPDVAMIRELNKRLKKRGIATPVYARTVRELMVHETLAQRKNKLAVEVPPEERAFYDRVAQEWLDYVNSSGIDVVGDVEDLRPRWPRGPWRDPDQPVTEEVLDSALRALVAVVLEDQRRYKAVTGNAPVHSLRAKVLRKLRRW